MFKQLLKKLGAWTTLMSWSEPFFFRVRLRSDLPARLAVAFGCGAVPTALLLILFAFNDRPPNPLHAFWALLLIGGLALMFLLRGKSTAGGRVRICEEGIVRTRTYVSFLTQVIEESSWKYEQLQAAAVVPSNATGSSFALLMLASDSGLDMIGLPASVDLQQLTNTMAARGRQLQLANEIPASLRTKLSLPLGFVLAATGFMALLVGGGVYAAKSYLAAAGRPGGGIAAPIPERIPELGRKQADGIVPIQPVQPVLPGLFGGGNSPAPVPAPAPAESSQVPFLDGIPLPPGAPSGGPPPPSFPRMRRPGLPGGPGVPGGPFPGGPTPGGPGPGGPPRGPGIRPGV